MKTKPPSGARVEVTQGGLRGKRGTVVTGVSVNLCLTVGGDKQPGSDHNYYLDRPGIVLIKFDEDLGGGYWGSGVFQLGLNKVRVIPPLLEIAEQSG